MGVTMAEEWDIGARLDVIEWITHKLFDHADAEVEP